MFACEREGVVPDLLCIGKALGGGVPLSATIGTPASWDAWPPSTGEALHTSTFLGNPLACAAALANLEQLAQLDLVARVRAREPSLAARLRELVRYRTCATREGAASCGASSSPTVRSRIASVVLGLALGVVLLQSGPTGTSITIAAAADDRRRATRPRPDAVRASGCSSRRSHDEHASGRNRRHRGSGAPCTRRRTRCTRGSRSSQSPHPTAPSGWRASARFRTRSPRPRRCSPASSSTSSRSPRRRSTTTRLSSPRSPPQERAL